VEYPGAIYPVMSRGDRREPIFKDDVDYRRFLDTLGEATEIRPDSVGGRFAQFLPEMTPTEEDRKIAMLYLAAKGIIPAEKRDKYREQGRAMF
jgi:hypothetical protein